MLTLLNKVRLYWLRFYWLLLSNKTTRRELAKSLDKSTSFHTRSPAWRTLCPACSRALRNFVLLVPRPSCFSSYMLSCLTCLMPHVLFYHVTTVLWVLPPRAPQMPFMPHALHAPYTNHIVCAAAYLRFTCLHVSFMRGFTTVKTDIECRWYLEVRNKINQQYQAIVT